jgi:hypothetical protein
MRMLSLGMVVTLIAAFALPDEASADDKKKRKRRRKRDKQPVEQPAPPPDPAPMPEPEPPKPEPPAGPWAEGVTAEQKAEAGRLLGEGNQLFLDGKLAEALARYEEAIKSWDHPAIRFNMVRVLAQLNRPVEAQVNLELALKYGSAPLEEGVYQEALTVKALLANQVADIEVGCDQAGVTVTLDAEPLLECPGKKTTRLMPGKHLVVGKKKGFLTDTKEVIVMGGRKETVALKLVAMEKAGVPTRRWANWKPWAVVGAGAVIGGVGGLLQWRATVAMDEYERAVARECADTGCTPQELEDALIADKERTAKLYNKIGIGLIAGGGAAVVAGAVLVFMNRQYMVYPEVDGRSAGVNVALRF